MTGREAVVRGLRYATLLIAAWAPGVAVAREVPLPERPLLEARRGHHPAPETVAFLGVVTIPESGGLGLARVVAGSAAERAGLRAGDVLRTVGDRVLRTQSDLDAALESYGPGVSVRVSLVRGGALLERTIALGVRRRAEVLFRAPLFRLAVVPVTFADSVEPPASGTALERFFFARSGIRGPGASLTDYFVEQSAGSFRLEGRIFEPLRVAHDRAHYAARPMGALEGSLYVDAARLLVQREGSLAFREFDGVAFLYPGAADARPGSGLWPHRAVISLAGRRVPYYVHAQETVGQRAIGEHCHEFAHLLGLPDRYGTGHLTGSGDFCLMAVGHRGGAQAGPTSPFSLCAWCRMRLGWLPTVIVDPAVPQRLRLPRSVGRDGGALVVPLDDGCREYLLLEARARAGFDRELPSAGLLVWRVGGAATPGQGAYGAEVDLVEAHGIDTFDASFVRTDEIAFPTVRARDLTPDTVPSSSSLRPGGLQVHLTDVRRHADGSVSVTIGVPRTVVQRPPEPLPVERPAADGTVTRIDPITGETVRFEVFAPLGGGASVGPAERAGDGRR